MRQPKKLFLVAEEFEDSRFMISRMLALAGNRVLEAIDGKQAVELAVKKTPAIILMDLSLPKLDGLSATRKIRRHKHLASLPIVAVSAHDSPESRRRALEAGCNEYVAKPI